jgi:hypothetical protein
MNRALAVALIVVMPFSAFALLYVFAKGMQFIHDSFGFPVAALVLALSAPCLFAIGLLADIREGRERQRPPDQSSR